MTLTRGQIIAETRDWIGTPYQHQASVKGVGCDCLGLVRGVWRAVIGEEPERAPPYAPDWAEAASGEPLAAAAARHLVALSRAPTQWCMRMTAPRSPKSRWRRGGDEGSPTRSGFREWKTEFVSCRPG